MVSIDSFNLRRTCLIHNYLYVLIATLLLVVTLSLPTVTASAAPSGFVSDDFNGCALNTDLWTLVDPLGDATLNMSGTHALLGVPAGTAHDAWSGGSKAPRLMQSVANTDFELEIKFDSGVDSRYQLQGLIVEQDAQNYLRFDFHSERAGTRIFVAKIVDGSPAAIKSTVIAAGGATPLYMRVARDGDLWTQSYSFDGSSWTEHLSGYQHPLTVAQVGPFVGNAGSKPAHVAAIDYVFDTAAPIVPEDGNENTVTTDVDGSGDVTVTPDQATYACNESVELTAVPDAGWTFGGWSGDLTGTQNPATLLVDGDMSVTATFTEGEADPYTLTTNVVGSGTITQNPDQTDYFHGETVELTAVPDVGWTFAGWSGDLTGTQNPTTLTMSQDTVITATFSAEGDVTPPVISNVQVAPAETTATISWTTDEPATGSVAFGQTTSYEAGSVSHSNLVTEHSITLTGLTPDTLYHYQINAVDASNNVTTTQDATFTTVASTGNAPVIDIWYGPTQTFGHLGLPQEWINILGNVSDPDGDEITSLVYSLNGGPETALSIGPDDRRLEAPGDFNADIAHTDLADGANQVVITATDSTGRQTVETVTVEYSSAPVWPLPYTIDWSTVSSIQDAAQVVDGLWSIGPDGVRPAILGYDRLVGIGDLAWSDYEVLVPITIHAVDMAGAGGLSGTPGLGLLLRWTGHTDDPVSGWQPKSGWKPYGAIGWWRWSSAGSAKLELYETRVSQAFTPALGVRYLFRMRVESVPGEGGLYRLKVWEDGQPEPSGWNLSYQEDATDLDHGSFLLLAHHVDASFGNVTVTPLISYTLQTNPNPIGGGTVTRDPVQETYTFGQAVTLSASPDPGWSFADWSGGLNGTTNPDVVTITDDTVVTATFTQDAYTLDVNVVGDGSVASDPDQADYVYGDVVTLTAAPDLGRSFAGWSGALSGTSNPATVTITGDTVVTATFTQNEYALDIDVVGSGDVAKHPDQDTYHYVDVVTLTANPDPGWSFAGWSGGLSGSTNPDVVTITDDTVVTATFTQDVYTLDVNVVGDGSVASDPDQADYVYGDVVTLTATPATGWFFAGWSGDIEESTNSATLTITGNHSITASFVQHQYPLTLNILGQGVVEVEPNQSTYTYGSWVTLTAIADPLWEFAGWSGDFNGDDNPATFMITNEHAITATFERTYFRVFLPLLVDR